MSLPLEYTLTIHFMKVFMKIEKTIKIINYSFFFHKKFLNIVY